MKKIGIILPTNEPTTQADILHLANEVTEVIDYKEAIKREIVIPEYSPNAKYVIAQVKSKGLLGYFWPRFSKKKEITKKTQKFRK